MGKRRTGSRTRRTRRSRSRSRSSTSTSTSTSTSRTPAEGWKRTAAGPPAWPSPPSGSSPPHPPRSAAPGRSSVASATGGASRPTRNASSLPADDFSVSISVSRSCVSLRAASCRGNFPQAERQKRPARDMKMASVGFSPRSAVSTPSSPTPSASRAPRAASCPIVCSSSARVAAVAWRSIGVVVLGRRQRWPSVTACSSCSQPRPCRYSRISSRSLN
eukprot:COSAG04_NODE_2366_length_4262_cov_66.150613_3_plen_218_part_00